MADSRFFTLCREEGMEMDKNQIMYLRKLEEKDMGGMVEWMQDSEIRKSFHFSNRTKRREKLNL